MQPCPRHPRRKREARRLIHDEKPQCYCVTAAAAFLALVFAAVAVVSCVASNAAASHVAGLHARLSAGSDPWELATTDVWSTMGNLTGVPILPLFAPQSNSGARGAELLAFVDGGGARATAVLRGSQQGTSWRNVSIVPWGGARTQFGWAWAPSRQEVALAGGRSAAGTLFADVWASADEGSTWREVTPKAPFGRRASTMVALQDGTLVLMGGLVAGSGVGGQPTLANDVWSSPNGEKWEVVAKQAPWAARVGHGAVAVGQVITLCGGAGASSTWYADCWVSRGGASWHQLTPAAGWSPRQVDGHLFVIPNSPTTALVLVGGTSSSSVHAGPDAQPVAHSDVWLSRTGYRWTQVMPQAAAPWSSNHTQCMGATALPGTANIVALVASARPPASVVVRAWRSAPLCVAGAGVVNVSVSPADGGELRLPPEQDNLGACAVCPGGEASQGGFNAPACSECDAGTFAPPGSAECQGCRTGTWSTPGAMVCNACQPGQHGTTNGSACLPCGPNTYVGVAGAEECSPCPAGTDTAGLSGRVSVDECQRCSPGTTTPGPAASCAPCPEGTFASAAGQPACTSCQPGTFNNRTGSTNATDCRVCKPGSYSSAHASVCTLCPAGTFNPRTATPADALPACFPCGNNTSSPPGSAQCTSCASGHGTTTPGAASCTPCIPGFAAPVAGMGCSACAAGSYAPGPGATVCLPCKAGTYCHAGSAQGIPCDVGHFCPPNSTAPRVCPVGSVGCDREGVSYPSPSPVQRLRYVRETVTSAQLHWDAPVSSGWEPDSGAGGVRSYSVQVTPGGLVLLVPGNTTSCTVSWLSPDVLYTFQVRVTNRWPPYGQNSTWHVAAEATPGACVAGQYQPAIGMACVNCPARTFCRGNDAPGTPQPCPARTYCPGGTAVPGASSPRDLRVVPQHAGELLLHWWPPLSGGGEAGDATITSYSVATGDTLFVTVSANTTCNGVSGCEFVTPSLRVGVPYQVCVWAYNSKGGAGQPHCGPAVTALDVPDAPAGVTATVKGLSATVEWVPSPFFGGARSVNYTVSLVPLGTAAGAHVVQETVMAPDTSAVLGDVLSGTKYNVTVVARNAAGVSPPSLPVYLGADPSERFVQRTAPRGGVVGVAVVVLILMICVISGMQPPLLHALWAVWSACCLFADGCFLFWLWLAGSTVAYSLVVVASAVAQVGPVVLLWRKRLCNGDLEFKRWRRERPYGAWLICGLALVHPGAIAFMSGDCGVQPRAYEASIVVPRRLSIGVAVLGAVGRLGVLCLRASSAWWDWGVALCVVVNVETLCGCLWICVRSVKLDVCSRTGGFEGPRPSEGRPLSFYGLDMAQNPGRDDGEVNHE